MAKIGNRREIANTQKRIARKEPVDRTNKVVDDDKCAECDSPLQSWFILDAIRLFLSYRFLYIYFENLPLKYASFKQAIGKNKTVTGRTVQQIAVKPFDRSPSFFIYIDAVGGLENDEM
jgi:hypothetical protein